MADAHVVPPDPPPVPGAGKSTARALTALKSFCAGTLAGIVGKFVEYPLDTIKVRLQTQHFTDAAVKQFSGPMDCMRETFREEGVKGFYKGVTSPVVGAIGENIACFVLYDQVKLQIASWTNASSVHDLPLRFVAVAGACSGAGTATVLTPVELVKCRIQVQQAGAAAGSSSSAQFGVLQCIRDIARTDGLRGFTRGGFSTMLREVPGNAIWFSSYEAITRALLKPHESREDVDAIRTVFAGGTAGALYWAIPYPIDTVKSYMQTNSKGVNSMRQAARDIYRTSGIRGFYTGMPITVVRAFPANALVFLVYERLSRLFGV